MAIVVLSFFLRSAKLKRLELADNISLSSSLLFDPLGVAQRGAQECCRDFGEYAVIGALCLLRCRPSTMGT